MESLVALAQRMADNPRAYSVSQLAEAKAYLEYLERNYEWARNSERIMALEAEIQTRRA